MNEKVTILLATYNGATYIHRQIDSLLQQTHTNWHLLIRDDNSTDDTLNILIEYEKKYPENIKILYSGTKNVGSVRNFSLLLQAIPEAKYIMFCDQDDEWKKNKIETTLLLMQQLESQYGNQHSLLVFTNFQYVDENINIIESKRNFIVNRFKNISFPRLLAQNPVYGCTTMINRALANKVKMIPSQAENHDYWIALVASICGTIFYHEEKTIFYRQHGKNISGAFDNNSIKKRFVRIILQRESLQIAERKRRMLQTLKEMYTSEMNQTVRSTLNNFLKLYKNKSPFLIYKNIRNGVISQTRSQTFLLYVILLLYKPKNKTSL